MKLLLKPTLNNEGKRLIRRPTQEILPSEWNEFPSERANRQYNIPTY